MSPLNITQPLDSIRYMVYNGYYKVMSNIPKMGHLTTPAPGWPKRRVPQSNLGAPPWTATGPRPAVANFRALQLAVRTRGFLATFPYSKHHWWHLHQLHMTWCCNLKPNYVMWWCFRKRQRTASAWRTTSCAQQFWEFPAELNPSSLCSFTFQSGLANYSLVDCFWLAYWPCQM